MLMPSTVVRLSRSVLRLSHSVVRLSRSVVSQKPYFIRIRQQSDYGDNCMRSLDTVINLNCYGQVVAQIHVFRIENCWPDID